MEWVYWKHVDGQFHQWKSENSNCKCNNPRIIVCGPMGRPSDHTHSVLTLRRCENPFLGVSVCYSVTRAYVQWISNFVKPLLTLDWRRTVCTSAVHDAISYILSDIFSIHTMIRGVLVGAVADPAETEAGYLSGLACFSGEVLKW